MAEEEALGRLLEKAEKGKGSSDKIEFEKSEKAKKPKKNAVLDLLDKKVQGWNKP